jgi:hypothetical protein
LPKIQKANRFTQRARREVHVPRRHADRRVTEQVLDRFRRSATHRKVRRERVPKRMGPDLTKPGSLASEPKRRLDRRLCERTPVRVAEHKLGTQVPMRAQCRT